MVVRLFVLKNYLPSGFLPDAGGCNPEVFEIGDMKSPGPLHQPKADRPARMTQSGGNPNERLNGQANPNEPIATASLGK